MKILTLLLVCFGGLIVNHAARADELSTFSRILCGKTENVAVVQFAQAYNSDAPSWLSEPSGIDHGISRRVTSESASSCTLENGVQIDLEQGSNQESYGECGASPDQWANLWVNKREVYRHLVFAGCRGQAVHSIVVDAQNVSICEFTDDPTDFMHMMGPSDDPTRPVACRTVMNTNAPLPMDYHKFPPPGETSDSGRVVLQYAALSPNQCMALRAEGEASGGDEVISEDSVSLDNVTRFNIDLFNRGKKDKVYFVSFRSNADDGDYIYVVNNNDVGKKFDDGKWNLKDFNQESIFHFSGIDSLYRHNFTYISILRKHGRTFLSLVPVSDTSSLRQIVYEGDPQEKLRTVCIFARR